MARLLLVDDDPAFLRWEAAVLATDGHEVLTACSGEEALKAVRDAPPDLILLDILMPDMDGRLLHDQIRKTTAVPVVFVSVTHHGGESVLRGASGYVTKPLDPHLLLSAVQSALTGTTDPGTILVVDDERDIRSLFRTVLTASGYVVATASNGQDAFERLGQEPRVGLVITDVHMQPMNGLELVRAMRHDPRFERVPVIVQTSDDLVARDNCWVELGVEQAMVKDEFLRWLRTTVRSKVGGRLGPEVVSAPAFDDLLGELRAEYLRDAPLRLSAMQQALAALAADRWDVAALAGLRLAFHAFAGNGRTYGFPEVTRLGLEGDVQCAARQRRGPPQDADVLGWHALVEAIERALRDRPSAGSRVPAPPGDPPGARATRILSVDDDPHQGAFLRAVLSAAGYEVRICQDPARFFDEHRAFGPDLVLMDVVLPGASGYEMARSLRSQEPDLPIVFLTTAGEPEEAARAGAAELLRKPVDPTTLLAALSRRLGSRRA